MDTNTDNDTYTINFNVPITDPEIIKKILKYLSKNDKEYYYVRHKKKKKDNTNDKCKNNDNFKKADDVQPKENNLVINEFPKSNFTFQQVENFIDEKIDLWEKNNFADMKKNHEIIENVHVKMKQTVNPIIKKNPIKDTYFITIDPMEGVIFEDFKHMIDEYLKCKSILAYEAVYKQKGQDYDTFGQGFYVYIILRVKPSYKMLDITEKIQKIFGNYIGVGQPDIIIVKNAHDIEKQRAYMKNSILDVPKRLANMMEKIWRKRLNLEEIYTKSSL